MNYPAVRHMLPSSEPVQYKIEMATSQRRDSQTPNKQYNSTDY